MTCHTTCVFLVRHDVLQRMHGIVDRALQEHFPKERSSWFGELLAQLDDAAARQILEELSQLAQLTEPHVAHDLSQALPPGDPSAMDDHLMCAPGRLLAPCPRTGVWHAR